MSSVAVSCSYIIIAKGLLIDYYDYSNHIIINLHSLVRSQESDSISDIVISSDNKYFALITSSKHLIVYNLPYSEKYKIYPLHRSASKIRFTCDNTHLLVADKSGDVILYDINTEGTGTKLLGHLSLLLDVLQTDDSKFIITSDRDEKIRVSCYPNTYNIQTFCLGHKEFVNHLELLSHDKKYLLSTSGDGMVKLWDYHNGRLYYTIDTYTDLNDKKLKENFVKKLDEDGIEVDSLPIEHFTVTKFNETCSLLAVSIHMSNELLIYSINTKDKLFNHKLEQKLLIENALASIKFVGLNLYVHNDSDSRIKLFKPKDSEKILFECMDSISFDDKVTSYKENTFESIKILYKRKFDNVQEYQERKKQRLENDKLQNCQ